MMEETLKLFTRIVLYLSNYFGIILQYFYVHHGVAIELISVNSTEILRACLNCPSNFFHNGIEST
jgi:hypothetical protein